MGFILNIIDTVVYISFIMMDLCFYFFSGIINTFQTKQTAGKLAVISES